MRAQCKFRPIVGVVAAMLAFYFYAGFHPFEFSPPVALHKNAAQTQGEWIHFARPGIATTQSAPDWLKTLKGAESFVVELDIASRPMFASHMGRILAISKYRGVRNLVIGQDKRELSVRFRAGGRSKDQMRTFEIANVFAKPAQKSLRVEIQREFFSIALDGKQLIKASLKHNPLETWSTDHRLTVGNSLSFDRPWLGIVQRAEIFIDGNSHVYGASELDIPQRYFAVSSRAKRQLRRIINSTDTPMRGKRDAVVNVLGFIPLSAVLVLFAGLSPWRAIACGVALSLSIELGQFFFVRFPSLFDFALNTLGSALGAWFATALRRHIR